MRKKFISPFNQPPTYADSAALLYKWATSIKLQLWILSILRNKSLILLYSTIILVSSFLLRTFLFNLSLIHFFFSPFPLCLRLIYHCCCNTYWSPMEVDKDYGWFDAPCNTRLFRVRAEDHCNPCLHIKGRQEILPAITLVAECHLSRCLACGLQLCQMGIMRLQDILLETAEAPKWQKQALLLAFIDSDRIFICSIYFAVCMLLNKCFRSFDGTFLKTSFSHLVNKVIEFAPDTFRSKLRNCLTFTI